MLPKAMIKIKKNPICKIFHQNKFRKFWWKWTKWGMFFQIWLIFAPDAFFTLAPPSGYNLNLKTLTKVSKVSRTSQLSHEILWALFEREVRKEKLQFSPKTPPKSQVFLGLSDRNSFFVVKRIHLQQKRLECQSENTLLGSGSKWPKDQVLLLTMVSYLIK